MEYRSEQYKGSGNAFFGKRHKEESKRYGSDNLATTDEVRAKMRKPKASKTFGRILSDESKARISSSLKGRTQSPEVRQKKRESALKRWKKIKEVH